MAFLKRLAAAAVAVEGSVARGLAEVIREPAVRRAPAAHFGSFQETLQEAASQGARGFQRLAQRLTEACGEGLLGLFRSWKAAGGLAACLAVGWFARAPLGRILGGPSVMAQELESEVGKAVGDIFHAQSAIAPCMMCPVTGKVFVDPVLTPTGRSYERAAIEEWIGREGTDPVSGAPLEVGQLVPNLVLRQAVESLGHPAQI